MFSLRATAAFILLALPSLAYSQTTFAFFEPVVPPRSVQVMVHRGMAMAAPENTASAIEMCAQDFCEWVEIDVRLTKDGQHVVMHNDSLEATTNGTGKVAEHSIDDLKKLDAGSWFARRFAGTKVLTLIEALALAKGKINLYLDCKDVEPKLLVKEILAAEMEHQVIVYGSVERLEQVKAASQGSIAGMTKFRTTMNFETFVKDVAPAAVEIDADEITAEWCQRFHAAGIKVQAKVLGKTWDNPTVWMKVIDAGTDWLQTDRPVALLFFNARRWLGKFPVMIACHRGAGRYAPENSLAAIREAAQVGSDFVEIDIRTTKDERTVLMHDSSVNRTSDGQGSVRSLLYEDVAKLSVGAWFGKPFQLERVPTFDQGMSEIGNQMGVYLDAKDIAPAELITMIQKYKVADRHVVYQSLAYCKELRKLDRTVRIMPPLKSLDQLDAIAESKPFAVDANWGILSTLMIDECHRRGIKVFSDALGRNEDVAQYSKAIAAGIDCIQTDHPLRVLRAIELVAE
jgi:glycerophosphoryl diester phosphodiesterase